MCLQQDKQSGHLRHKTSSKEVDTVNTVPKPNQTRSRKPILDPKGKVHEWNNYDLVEIPNILLLEDYAVAAPLSHLEVAANPQINNRNNTMFQENKLLAVQQKYAENRVRYETSVKVCKPAATAKKVLQSQPMIQQQFQQQQQLEKSRQQQQQQRQLQQQQEVPQQEQLVAQQHFKQQQQLWPEQRQQVSLLEQQPQQQHKQQLPLEQEIPEPQRFEKERLEQYKERIREITARDSAVSGLSVTTIKESVTPMVFGWDAHTMELLDNVIHHVEPEVEKEPQMAGRETAEINTEMPSSARTEDSELLDMNERAETPEIPFLNWNRPDNTALASPTGVLPSQNNATQQERDNWVLSALVMKKLREKGLYDQVMKRMKEESETEVAGFSTSSKATPRHSSRPASPASGVGANLLSEPPIESGETNTMEQRRLEISTDQCRSQIERDEDARQAHSPPGMISREPSPAESLGSFELQLQISDWEDTGPDSENESAGEDQEVITPPPFNYRRMIAPEYGDFIHTAAVYAHYQQAAPSLIGKYGKRPPTKRRIGGDGRISKDKKKLWTSNALRSLYMSVKSAMQGWRHAHRGWIAAHERMQRLDDRNEQAKKECDDRYQENHHLARENTVKAREIRRLDNIILGLQRHLQRLQFGNEERRRVRDELMITKRRLRITKRRLRDAQAHALQLEQDQHEAANQPETTEPDFISRAANPTPTGTPAESILVGGLANSIQMAVELALPDGKKWSWRMPVTLPTSATPAETIPPPAAPTVRAEIIGITPPARTVGNIPPEADTARHQLEQGAETVNSSKPTRAKNAAPAEVISQPTTPAVRTETMDTTSPTGDIRNPSPKADELRHILELGAEATDPPHPAVAKEEADPAHFIVGRGKINVAFPSMHDKTGQQQYNTRSNFHVLKNYDKIESCASTYHPGTGCGSFPASPDVKLPAGTPEPPLPYPVTDEILFKPPTRPPPLFPESTPAKNPMNREGNVTVGPLPPRTDYRPGARPAPSAVPPPSPTGKGDITIKPSIAFPDVTLPRDAEEPPPFQPVADEMLPTTPIRPRSPFSQSTPTENPVNEEENATVGPTAPPLPPITHVLGKPPAPAPMTSHPGWCPPSPVGAHYPTPSPLPLYKMYTPTLSGSGESPGISTNRHLDFKPGEEENKEWLPFHGNLPAPPTGDTPPPDPLDPPPDTPPCPPPIQPLLDSEKKSVKEEEKASTHSIISNQREENVTASPAESHPPIIQRDGEDQRLSNIPDEEIPTPSPSRKRSQPEEETEPIVLRETRRRIAITAEERALPDTPPRGRRTCSTEPPRSPSNSSRSKARRSLLS